MGLRVLVYIGGVAGGGGYRQEAWMQWTLSDARHGWQGALVERAVVQRAPRRLRSRSSLELCVAFSLETRRWGRGARLATRRALQALLLVACRDAEALPLWKGSLSG